MRYTFRRTQFINRPRHEVFNFFSKAANLELLTPPFLRFSILTDEPITMGEGTLIDYQLSLYGIPFKWRTQIGVYEPEVRFTDTQLKGPYRYWHHLHEFRDIEGGTEMVDVVDYEVPLGPLGNLARRLFVERNLNTIFNYRRDTIAQYFGDA